MSEESGKRQGLGRGLSALLGDDSEDYASLDRVRSSKEVPIEHLRPGRFQPRRRFDPVQTEALVSSIRERGILQPILVRRAGDDSYEIVAGERRWRAAQEAKLHEVPVIIKELSDTDALEVALVENLQREDLTLLEEAEGYRRMIDEFGHTQERLARAIGRSRSHLANTLRLLGLPDEVKHMLDDGRLSAGHGRALLAAGEPVKLAAKAVRQGLNVRQVERLAQGQKRGGGTGPPHRDADTLALEKDIAAALGLPVAIRHKGEAGGEIRVSYRTLEQLDEVCKRLAQTPQLDSS